MSGRRREIAAYFLRLGAIGFGGPNAHIAMMREELVDRRRWVDERRFLDIVGATNLIPGPNSSEISMHLGYEREGRVGGLVAGLAFAAPAFVMVLALARIYVSIGPTAARADLLAGVQPAALAAIAVALWKLRAAALGGWLRPTVAVGGFALTLLFPSFAPLVIVAGGAAALAARHATRAGAASIVPLLVIGPVVVAETAGLGSIAWVFLRTGVLLFGGGLVLVPLLEPEVVRSGWLTRREFLDGIAVGQSTPGPIVMTAAFVGFLLAGLAGALVATAAIYLPSFVAVLFLTGPLLRRFKEQPDVKAFVGGVSATAIGSVAGSAVLLAPAALGTPFRGVVGLLALLALVRRAAVAWVMLAAAALGLAAGAAGVT
jgi:chromate transporter